RRGLVVPLGACGLPRPQSGSMWHLDLDFARYAHSTAAAGRRQAEILTIGWTEKLFMFGGPSSAARANVASIAKNGVSRHAAQRGMTTDTVFPRFSGFFCAPLLASRLWPLEY